MIYKNKEKELKNKKEYYLKNREKILAKMRIYGKKWYLKNIEKIRLQHKIYERQNKGKRLEYFRRWYRKNKDRILAASKAYYQRRKEIIQQRHRAYNKKNKENLLNYKRGWQKQKRKIDPRWRLNENMQSAIWRCIKSNKAGERWESLVDYTLKDLMNHLEKNFTEKIDWDNYGSYWAIDHIKPKSLFTYSNPKDAEFKKCWGLENLQPLEKTINIKKGNRYVD